MTAEASAHSGWTIAVHGGAGSMTRDRLPTATDTAARAALGRALDAGEKLLAAHGSALDAVEAAVRILEDDPVFNAGRGAALTLTGSVELDAAIMDGSTRAAGAVAGVATTRNPVSLARAVMTHSPHVLLAGTGADGFAREQGLEQVDPAWFVIEDRRANLAAMLARPDNSFDVDMKYGTVGAVARDAFGHVAAATSTGGVTGKRPGRIGDTPLIGAGTLADDRAAAISATGSGEFFIRAGVAHEIAARMRLAGERTGSAIDAALADALALGGRGGVIVVTTAGEAHWAFTTPAMYRGRASARDARVIAIYADEP